MKLGLPSLLTIVFVVLKLCDVIAWSWWLVFLPVIIAAGGLLLFVVGSALLGMFIVSRVK